MEQKLDRQDDLKRIFDIYCDINNFKQRMKNGSPLLKNAVVIIANGDDDKGSVLVKLISSEFNSDELWYEGQPFIVCGLAERLKVQTLLKKLDLKVAKKLKKFSGIPVVVSDYDSIEIFPL
jgi:hypothetical protein